VRVTEESKSNRESERGEAPLPNHLPLSCLGEGDKGGEVEK